MRISSKDHTHTVKPEKEQATDLATLKSPKGERSMGEAVDESWGGSQGTQWTAPM